MNRREQVLLEVLSGRKKATLPQKRLLIQVMKRKPGRHKDVDRLREIVKMAHEACGEENVLDLLIQWGTELDCQKRRARRRRGGQRKTDLDKNK